jgi:dihydroorotate dehydrogenase electron transfer subunit
MPNIYHCEITENTQIADGVFSITFASAEIASEAAPGLFLHVKCGDALLLRRPISICCVRENKVRFVFEVVGEGTGWLAERGVGERLNILGALGNGFSLPEGRVIVVGGGIGVPPMLFAAESAKAGCVAVLGFRSKDKVILTDEFKAACETVYITTDDGSMGIHGMVTEPLEELLKIGGFNAVMSCGPYVMQKELTKLCSRYSMPCLVSLEERMGCGVGACLVCACATIRDGAEYMSCVCVDGPVFDANTVIWN